MEHYLGIQTVSDKTVADCVEALIGVYLRSMGIKDTLMLLQWFQILPYKIDANELLFGTPQNPIISEGNINHLMPWASNIETKLGYRFNNRGYLKILLVSTFYLNTFFPYILTSTHLSILL